MARRNNANAGCQQRCKSLRLRSGALGAGDWAAALIGIECLLISGLGAISGVACTYVRRHEPGHSRDAIPPTSWERATCIRDVSNIMGENRAAPVTLQVVDRLPADSITAHEVSSPVSGMYCRYQNQRRSHLKAPSLLP